MSEDTYCAGSIAKGHRHLPHLLSLLEPYEIGTLKISKVGNKKLSL